MAGTRKRTTSSPRQKKAGGFKLPTEKRAKISNPWQFAYLITGEKKIGKTSFAIEGCNEPVLQFDKPQLAYDICEVMLKTWRESMDALKELEARAESGDFPYDRVIIDGVGEWYSMCQTATCKHFGIDHPSEEGYAKGWHHLRDNFTDAVNRLLRLQHTASCGIVFIAHAEWREVNIRGGGKVDKLVPNLGSRCEEIVNGKVDGWFCYDYVGENRVLVVRGDQTTGAGHRIDGRFQTTDDRQVVEIPMGNSAHEAMENFVKGFNNKLEYATYKEMRDTNKPSKPARRASTKRGTRRNKAK